MTLNEFKYWLEGYLAGFSVPADAILDKLDDVIAMREFDAVAKENSKAMEEAKTVQDENDYWEELQKQIEKMGREHEERNPYNPFPSRPYPHSPYGPIVSPDPWPLTPMFNGDWN